MTYHISGVNTFLCVNLTLCELCVQVEGRQIPCNSSFAVLADVILEFARC
jgi:hypothetical protein